MCVCVCVCVCVHACAQSYQTLCHPMGYSPPGSSTDEIFQARILEWAAISSSTQHLSSVPLVPAPSWVGEGLRSDAQAGRGGEVWLRDVCCVFLGCCLTSLSSGIFL